MITIDEARAHYPSEDTAHSFAHVLRVLKLAERIGRAEGADMEVLRAAVLLHDIARVAEDAGGPCHAEAGAEQAGQILSGHPPAKVEAVAHAIRAHRFRATSVPQTLEAKILYDADKLDAIGAIGIARAYAIAGHHGQRLWSKVPDGFAERSIEEARRDVTDSEHTPVHEYRFKLSKLRDALFTTTARAIAAERHDYMARFFERLELEVDGEL